MKQIAEKLNVKKKIRAEMIKLVKSIKERKQTTPKGRDFQYSSFSL